MKRRKRPDQRAMHCPCGRSPLIARGLCATCYTLRRQDDEHFGGLREKVLERDGYLCRVCAELPEIDRLCAGQPPCVHHRIPGVSKLHLMITLCPAHHAQVERLQVVRKPMSRLLLQLWRELHAKGHEQIALNFATTSPVQEPQTLFLE